VYGAVTQGAVAQGIPAGGRPTSDNLGARPRYVKAYRLEAHT
jgi:hypothetical protein